jgi:hypothetical protein
VTPVSVEPLALPGPQTWPSVPKEPGPVVAVELAPLCVGVPAADVGVPLLPWLLHAASSRAEAAPSAAILECRCMGEPFSRRCRLIVESSRRRHTPEFH